MRKRIEDDVKSRDDLFANIDLPDDDAVWFAEIVGSKAIEKSWQILGESFEPPLRIAVDDYLSHLEKLARYSRTILAFVDTQISGGIAFYANDYSNKSAYITEVVVCPQFRGRGLGRKLLIAAIDIARDEGMDTVGLEVKKGNAVAKKLYDSMGFEIDGESITSYYMRAPIVSC